MEFAFHYHNTLAETGILMALERILGPLTAPPVLLCVGSDLAIGDALGPLSGTLVRKKAPDLFVYGTLKTPVTAKEVRYMESFLRKTHPSSKIVAVDAAVGEDGDVGLLKVIPGPLKPGSGANKRLGRVGDVSLLGVVAGKTAFSYSALSLTRLHGVYAMAEVVSDALSAYAARFRGEKICS